MTVHPSSKGLHTQLDSCFLIGPFGVWVADARWRSSIRDRVQELQLQPENLYASRGLFDLFHWSTGEFPGGTAIGV